VPFFSKAPKTAIANPQPLKLLNVTLLQYLKNFGPQNDHFLKMWPSSRFGLAMAGLKYSYITEKILSDIQDKKHYSI
jgi:hypothetical protein